MFDLSGRVALVTGGAGGIGLGIARGLARAGADVAITGRDASKSAAARAELEPLGRRCEVFAADVADPDVCRALPQETAARLGRLDILVNNAGVAIGGRPEGLSLEDWNQVLAVNLTAAMLLSQAAHPLMKAAGGGKIINIGSMYSLFGGAFVPAYAASKGGLVQLTRSLAVAWAKDNVQVNVILPGWIDTEMTRGARASAAFDAQIVARTPAGRWGEAFDLEGPAVFLASPASDFVTGAALAVDGGFAVSG